MTKIATGTITLQGTMRVVVTGIEDIDTTCVIIFRALGELKGALVRSEITPGEGFALFSLSPDDVCDIKWEVWTTPLPADE
jgi:hypothetical protein